MPWKQRRMTTLLIVLGIVIVALVALAIGVLSQIEDWQRDFATNFAAIEANAADERLRPLCTSLNPPSLADRVEAAMAPLANWKRQNREVKGDSIELHFVRSTALWG